MYKLNKGFKMFEIEFEFTSNNFDTTISGTLYYTIFEGQSEIQDFDYEIENENEFDSEEKSMMYDEVVDYVQNLEIDTDYEEYDTTFEKYL